MKRFSSFLSEGSIPGVKRGSYDNTKVMTTKIPDKDIRKANTEVLRSWSKRGGPNVSAAKAEIKDRTTSKKETDKNASTESEGDKEVTLTVKQAQDNRKSFVDDVKSLEKEMDMDISLSDSEITPDDKEELKFRKQEEKYKKAKEKWEKNKEKYFNIIDRESRLGKLLTTFFEAEPAPFPGMEGDLVTIMGALEKYYQNRAERKVSKFGKKETKASEKAEKASKEAREKAEKEREERKKREEDRKEEEEKRKKEQEKTEEQVYKGMYNTIKEVWIKT